MAVALLKGALLTGKGEIMTKTTACTIVALYSVCVPSLDLLDWIAVGGILPASEVGVNSRNDDASHALGPPSESQRRFYRIGKLP